MEDQFGKYFRLFGTIFFTFIGFILALILLMLGIKLLFGVLSYIPWLTYLYILLIVIFPATLFTAVYIIFIRKTRKHPSAPVRWLSYIVFTVALICWAYFFGYDLYLFFKHFYTTIDKYYTYNLLFLSLNVGCIFLFGVIQALTTAKEKDWMEKAGERGE